MLILCIIMFLLKMDEYSLLLGWATEQITVPSGHQWLILFLSNLNVSLTTSYQVFISLLANLILNLMFYCLFCAITKQEKNSMLIKYSYCNMAHVDHFWYDQHIHAFMNWILVNILSTNTVWEVLGWYSSYRFWWR